MTQTPTTTRVLAVTWLDLDQAALCLNEEVVFDIRERRCPSCCSQNFALLAKWLSDRKEVRA